MCETPAPQTRARYIPDYRWGGGAGGFRSHSVSRPTQVGFTPFRLFQVLPTLLAEVKCRKSLCTRTEIPPEFGLAVWCSQLALANLGAPHRKANVHVGSPAASGAGRNARGQAGGRSWPRPWGSQGPLRPAARCWRVLSFPLHLPTPPTATAPEVPPHT